MPKCPVNMYENLVANLGGGDIEVGEHPQSPPPKTRLGFAVFAATAEHTTLTCFVRLGFLALHFVMSI